MRFLCVFGESFAGIKCQVSQGCSMSYLQILNDETEGIFKFSSLVFLSFGATFS